MDSFDGCSQPKAMPRDAELGQQLESTAKEAQERISHHRAELVMWERIERAAQASLGMLSGELEMESEEADAARNLGRYGH